MAIKMIDTYNALVKQAEAEKVAEFTKYAEAANDLLAAEYGTDYTKEDVEKLANLMIENDSNFPDEPEVGTEEVPEVEKTAELEEAGRIMARAFVDELRNAK